MKNKTLMYKQFKSYNVAKKKEYAGLTYDSNFEAGYAQELDLRQKAGEILKWERQINLNLAVNGFIVCQYRIDFIVYYPDNTIEYVECKGYPTPVWKLKWKLFEALYSDLPDVKLTVIQQGRFKAPKPRRVKNYRQFNNN